MSYQYHGTTDLITLPGREVQTFPSGLVRITRTYVCRKGLEGQFRQLLAEGSVLPNDDAAPCIDGAYIFPTPIENIREDGFVEFRVTAYGRANATGTQRENIQQTVIDGATFSFADLIIENVLPSATALQNLNTAPDYEVTILAQSTSNDPLVRTVDIPVGATVEFDVLLGGATRSLGIRYIATSGGVIFERESDAFDQIYGDPLYQVAFLYNKNNVQLKSSTQKYFNFFSEFVTIYGISGSVASAIPTMRAYKINGVRV